MTGPANAISTSPTGATLAQNQTAPDPRAMAQTILGQTVGMPASFDKLGQIEARLDDIANTDPAFAAQVRAEIMASPMLSTTEKGQLTNNEPGRTVDLNGRITQRFVPNGMNQDQWINGQRTRNTPEYPALSRLAGSNDNEPIKTVMAELYNRGISASQLETERAATGPGNGEVALDLVQMTLDLTGIVDQSGISDGANAVISLGRGISSLFSGEWSAAGGHLVNGAISVVGVVPVLGDLAKAGKIGKWAETVSNAVQLAARLAPVLSEIRDLVGKIPQSALDALPAGARESLTAMKTQLDEFLGAGGRAADDVAGAGSRVVGNTLVLDANRGASFTAGGRAQNIGDVPPTRTDGNLRYGNDVNGNEVRLRQPATYDSVTRNADGTVDYTKGTRTVRYDANGFPEFSAKADLFLDPSHINTSSDAGHFRAANEMMGNALRADPGLAQRIGLNDAQVAYLTRANPASAAPPGLTWHHHQDTGRIQLVDRAEHAHFSGGHTGGMRLWGGGRN